MSYIRVREVIGVSGDKTPPASNKVGEQNTVTNLWKSLYRSFTLVHIVVYLRFQTYIIFIVVVNLENPVRYDMYSMN